ncbi:hypothetical protein FGIG_08425 [Fasciola gigantica]|uniref:Uncharacterized protein n=1 Tax=Fasciola gigantica TaxID=46835 RepID=A0A504YE33_FASGI|nr:hypothetical protein FGIG_08425 [Fasciola gigantica]
MRMKIPQPIQLWFNEFNAKFSQLDKNVQTGEQSGVEWMGSLSTQKANPLLLIGLNTLILDTVSVYPLDEGVVDVLRVICNQLITFYCTKNSEVRNSTLELLPSIIFVYLCFFQRSITLQFCPNRGKLISHAPPVVLLENASVRDSDCGKQETDQPESHGSTAVTTKAQKADKYRDHMIDVHRAVELLEQFLLQIYTKSVTSKSTLDESQRGEADQTRLCTTPTVFNDPICLGTTMQERLGNVKNKPTNNADVSFSQMYDICWTELNQKQKTVLSVNVFTDQNRMSVLTAILHMINASVDPLPKFALHSICRVAMLVSPRRDHRQKARLEDHSKDNSSEMNNTSVESIAEYDTPLLVINSIRQLAKNRLISGSQFPIEADSSLWTTTALPESRPNELPPLNPKQISLASAYCSLWTELVEKKDHIIMTNTSAAEDIESSPASMKIVRVARDKFMRSIVTNANFQTAKPPDDIPVHTDCRKPNGTQERLKRSSSMDNSLAYSRVNTELASAWDGDFKNLVIGETGAPSGSKNGWIRRAFVPRKNNQNNKTTFSYVVLLSLNGI